MLKSSIASLALLALLPAAGCGYYFGDDDDDDCYYGGDYDQVPVADEYLRNPESGQCEYFGGGGGCDYACGPCAEPGYDDGAAEWYPSWAYCDGYCETLDEATCLETSGCRGAYIDVPGGPAFYQCWGTDLSGPIQGGGCDGLDAYTCSMHDDCIAVHASDAGCGGDPLPGGGAPEPCTGIGWFEYCADETTGCYSDDECGPGTHCNADEVCLPAPGCDSESPDGLIPCDAACYGYCVPDDVPDPGRCTGEVLCDSLPPDCPDDTTPGILDGCWSGYCIPLTACEDPPPPPPPVACSEIGDEEQCIGREDCTALYEGIDCTCDDLGNCECADWVFVECQ